MWAFKTQEGEMAFIRDVWYGQRSLGEMWWLWNVLIGNLCIGLGGGFLTKWLATTLGSQYPIYLYNVFLISYSIWLGVGLWRSATNHPGSVAYFVKFWFVANVIFILISSGMKINSIIWFIIIFGIPWVLMRSFNRLLSIKLNQKRSAYIAFIMAALVVLGIEWKIMGFEGAYLVYIPYLIILLACDLRYIQLSTISIRVAISDSSPTPATPASIQHAPACIVNADGGFYVGNQFFTTYIKAKQYIDQLRIISADEGFYVGDQFFTIYVKAKQYMDQLQREVLSSESTKYTQPNIDSAVR
jgi:hypothetical protein